MSLPFAARQGIDGDDPEETVPSESKTLVCPRCQTKWSDRDAPETCPIDGLALVRPRALAETEPTPSALKDDAANGFAKKETSGVVGTASLIGTPASGQQGDDPMVGRTLEGRYTILARLGAGSMGTVYRAKQHAMGRVVAIKILRGDRAVDDTAKARFMREARANSLLASPNTVTVFDFGQSESGECYLAMELLEGESLGQRLNRVGRLPVAVAVDAARQALRSLSEAHAKGIIHRDLKPDNLFFARVMTGTSARASRPDSLPPDSTSVPPPPSHHEELVKVLDFGIAKLIDANDESQPMGVVETQAGTVFGTPRYMSPEQAQGKPLDARSDLYSLGVILYQMLAGRPPFADNDAVVVMARHIKSIPKRISEVCPEANVPREVEDVVMRALAKDPAQRQANAEVLAGELLTALEAQGATSSGVRASITNAAGIRLPESLRPASIPLPRIPAAIPVKALYIAAPLVLLAVALGVFLGLSHRSAKPVATSTESVASDPAAAVRTSAVTTAPPAAPTPPSAAEVETALPVMTPDALPKATSSPRAGTGTGAAAAAKPIRGAGAQAAKPGHARPSPAASNAAGAPPPAAAPSSTSAYGIFE